MRADAATTINLNPMDILSQVPGLVVIVDDHSRALYTNNYTAQLFGYKNGDSVIGMGPYDMRCKAVECAEDFLLQDKIVRKNESTLLMLDIHCYANEQSKILLTTKKPFYQNNKLIGSICHCTEIHNTSLAQLTATLVSMDERYHKRGSGRERSYQIIRDEKHLPLSKRELECVFYLLRGHTTKMIAKDLDLSVRTVESYLNNIKNKLDCYNKSDLIDKCLSMGLLNYIPECTIQSNISGIIHQTID